MIKDENRQIDERASTILRDLLPEVSWQVYDLSPDIAKDHRIELVEKGDYLGIDFVVQLKGQKATSFTRDSLHVKYRIETKYLRYYETVRAPVFLVVVDVTSGLGYWLFVQR